MLAVSSPLVVRSALLSEVEGLAHGFGTRAKRRPLSGALIQLKQIHGDLIWIDPEPRAVGDGAITQAAGRLLAIRTADCCPILIADPKQRVVAAIHAGWRGTLARIAEKTVGEMRAAFGCAPGDLVAAIGPSIRGCCYTVGEEVEQAFRARFDYAGELFQEAEPDPIQQRYPALFMTGAPPGHPYDPRWNRSQTHRLDLAAANARQLREAGLSAEAIDVLPYCTACRPDLFFSHRRGESGRMLAAIGFQPGV